MMSTVQTSAEIERRISLSHSIGPDHWQPMTAALTAKPAMKSGHQRIPANKESAL